MPATVRLTRLGELALLILDRPEALNALGFSLLREPAAAFEDRVA